MIPVGVEVFIALDPIDLRWSFDRLAGMVGDRLGRAPRGGVDEDVKPLEFEHRAGGSHARSLRGIEHRAGGGHARAAAQSAAGARGRGVYARSKLNIVSSGWPLFAVRRCGRARGAQLVE